MLFCGNIGGKTCFQLSSVNKLTVGFCLWSRVLTIGNGIVNLREGQMMQRLYRWPCFHWTNSCRRERTVTVNIWPACLKLQFLWLLPIVEIWVVNWLYIPLLRTSTNWKPRAIDYLCFSNSSNCYYNKIIIRYLQKLQPASDYQNSLFGFEKVMICTFGRCSCLLITSNLQYSISYLLRERYTNGT